MNIVIIGAGAVGGIIAGYLSKHHYEIQLVCKHKNILKAIENHGLRIEGIRDNIISYPDTVLDIFQINKTPDIVLLAVKATDVSEVTAKLLPFLKEDSAVVSLQNGTCEDIIADIVKPERTVGCVVGWGATMVNPGKLVLTSTGEFIIGELNGEVTQRILIIKSLLEKVLPVEISNNIYGALFSKLIINSCINTLGAISGLYLGDLLKLKVARDIFLEVFREAVPVADALNIKLEKIGGKIDPYKFVKTEQEVRARFSISLLKKHLTMVAIGLKYRRLKSSSLQSLQRGRPTEIDFLNGYIVEKARVHNLPVTINQRLVSLVKDIEAGKHKISPANLNRILH